MYSPRFAAWAAGLAVVLAGATLVAAPPADWSGIPRAPARAVRASATGAPLAAPNAAASPVPTAAAATVAAPQSNERVVLATAQAATAQASGVPAATHPKAQPVAQAPVRNQALAPAPRVPPSRRTAPSQRTVVPSAQPLEVGTAVRGGHEVERASYQPAEGEMIIMPEQIPAPAAPAVTVGNEGVFIDAPHAGFTHGGCASCQQSGGGCQSGCGSCGHGCGGGCRPFAGLLGGCGLLGGRHCGPGVGLFHGGHGLGACNDCGDSCDSCSECSTDAFLGKNCGFTFDVRYLHWWTDEALVPPLVTTSADTVRNANTAALDDAATTVLLGGSDLADGDRNGIQGTLAWWMHDCSALELSYFSLGSSSVRSAGENSNTLTVIGIPFYDVSTSAENALLVAFPNFVSGSFDVEYRSEFQGAGVALRKVLVRDCQHRWDLLVGYRMASLDEHLRLETNILGGGQSAQPNTRVVQVDDFDVDNEFHGADLGMAGHWRYCNWTFSALGKVALGNSRSLVTIEGNTTQTSPTGGVTSGTGGIFAHDSNRGQYDSSDLSVMPELGVTAGLNTVCGIRATVGYTLLYWSRVGRPGDQIDRNVHPDQFFPAIAAEERPDFVFRPNHFWAQGVNVGFEFNF